MTFLRSIFVVLSAIFAVPVMGQVEARDGCTVPEALAFRTNIHQCADCSFRNRSPFDSRTDTQRCGEEALPTVVGPSDTNEFKAIFGEAPQARGTKKLRGVKLRAARQRYAERRANWGGVFISGDDAAPFYVQDNGEAWSASATSDPSDTELKIPGLDVEGLALYTAERRAEVDNIFETWGLGTPVLWIEYNSYVRNRVNGGMMRGTAIKIALPDAPLPLFFDSWAYMTFNVPHLKVSSAHMLLLQKCFLPSKLHTFVPPSAVKDYRADCE